MRFSQDLRFRRYGPHDLVAGLYPERADVGLDLLERPTVVQRVAAGPAPRPPAEGGRPPEDGVPTRKCGLVDPGPSRRPAPGRASGAGRLMRR